MANKKIKKRVPNNGIKKLDVLNSEGPVILATRKVGSNEVFLKFDNSKELLFTSVSELYSFFYNGHPIVNPSDHADVYVFENYSKDMQPSRESILEFFND